MIDITKTIAAKSDQLNADDLFGGAITIKIERVSIVAGEQPVAIHYEGDNGKPWKPCKSMRRVLVHAWGGDGNKYVGRHLTLYRDAAVTFGAQAVGGIRISHMSDISAAITMALTAAKNSKKQFTVKPLAAQKQEESKFKTVAVQLNDMALPDWEGFVSAVHNLLLEAKSSEDIDAIMKLHSSAIKTLNKDNEELFNKLRGHVTDIRGLLSIKGNE